MAVGFVFETGREVLYNKMLNIKETSAQYGLSAKQRVALTLTFPLFAGILSGVPNALANITYGILLQPKKPKAQRASLLFNLQRMWATIKDVRQNPTIREKQGDRLMLEGPQMRTILAAVVKNSEHILRSGLYRGLGMWVLFSVYNAPSLALEYLDTSSHLTVTKGGG